MANYSSIGGGALSGGVTGAQLGSFLGPGWGTAAGALVGAGIGGLIGYFDGEDQDRMAAVQERFRAAYHGIDDTNVAMQNQLLAQMQNAASGQGPSAAMQAFNATSQSNTNQAAALAASGRGGVAGSQMAAINAAAAANAKGAAEAQAARANEQIQAQALLGQTLGYKRQQDLQRFNSDMTNGTATAQPNAMLASGLASLNEGIAQYGQYKAKQDDRAFELEKLKLLGSLKGV